ncbi:unnamed protein product [Pleuronectes platessa]|uniref:Uncharacterized protein n=1 Tax=Pleuronectes platessa TaxID=8262 RepID=A0A9N7VKW8_PLEPL|nr:unnamed protein product [Pleuronectes platessa]
MRTKGIRQAEGESPYTVKTEGAAWWREGDSAPLTLHLKSLEHAGASARLHVGAHGDFDFQFRGRGQMIRFKVSDSSSVQRGESRHVSGGGLPPSTCSGGTRTEERRRRNRERQWWCSVVARIGGKGAPFDHPDTPHQHSPYPHFSSPLNSPPSSLPNCIRQGLEAPPTGLRQIGRENKEAAPLRSDLTFSGLKARSFEDFASFNPSSSGETILSKTGLERPALEDDNEQKDFFIQVWRNLTPDSLPSIHSPEGPG